MTHHTTYCTRGHRVCLCSQACDTPERCATWAPGASNASSGPSTRTTVAATVAHLAVAAAAFLALVFIVKTAAGA